MSVASLRVSGGRGKDLDSRPGNDGGGCREGDAASGGLSVRNCEGQSRRHVISRRTWVFHALGCAVSRLRGPRRDPFGVCQTRGIPMVFCCATKRIFALRRRRPERDCPLHAANDATTLRLLTRGYRGVSPAHGSLLTRGFQGRAGGFCAFREKMGQRRRKIKVQLNASSYGQIGTLIKTYYVVLHVNYFELLILTVYLLVYSYITNCA